MRIDSRPFALTIGLAILGGAIGLGLAPARPSQPEEGAAGGEAIVDGRLRDAAGVKSVLDALGYESQDAGGGNWLFTRKQGEWAISIYCLLNADSSVLWIKCYVGRLENPTTFSASHYLGLLEEQGRVSPRFFFTVPVADTAGSVDLYYCRGLDNRALSQELIGDEIALLQSTMGGCVASWNYTTWTRSGEATPAASPESAPTPP